MQEMLRRCVGPVVGLALAAALPAHAQDCSPPASPGAASEPLQIIYFGVSTLLFTAGDDQLLVDGFFTRPRTGKMLFGRVRPDTALIEDRLRNADVRRLHAVLVAHAHHDHGMDAAAIAKATRTRVGLRQQTNAVVVGTQSTVNLALAGGLGADQTCVAIPDKTLRFGPFDVRPVAADHGPAFPLLTWLLHGTTPPTIRLPAWFGDYKDTQNLSYQITYGERSILVHPSAGLPPRAPGQKSRPPLPKAELVFLGIGGLGVKDQDRTESLWRAAVRDTAALTVIPVHWDRFTERLEDGLTDNPWPLDQVSTTLERLSAREADTVEVCFLQAFDRISLPPRGAAPLGAPSTALPKARPGCRAPTDRRPPEKRAAGK